ncbi:MAG TPA: BatD family protein [Bacteroidales bacterium]|nr:BatD family protein [Bacteroidales bacterium]
MRNKLILAFVLMLSGASLQLMAAEAVTLTGEAPKQVIMGQYFNLVYSANAEVDDLRIAELSEFFEILYGPSTSMSSSTTIVNGKYQSSTSYGFTYVLRPKKTGTFTIPSATASVNGTKIKSNTLSIKVLPADQQSGGGQTQQHSSSAGSTANQNTGSSQSVSNDQVFIRAIPSKTQVREQEGLLVTYKIYTRVDISGMQNPKFPEFKGFMAQEIEVPQNRQWDLENYNGANYQTTILKQTVLYPRETGVLTIDKGSFDLIIRVKNRNARARSLFDDFFDTYSEVNKTVYCNSVKINVTPLPAGKPADFCGVSGNLNMTSSISSQKVKANEAVTIRIKISGNGNLKMIPTPELTFPADFDPYDPKVDNAFKNTTSGVSGTKTIEYLVIPRFPGTFEIPATSISFYDLATRQYKRLTTQPYTIEVGKGDGNVTNISGKFSNQEQLRLLGSDIRYLKTNIKLQKQPRLFFATTAFWLAYLLPLFFFGIMLLINRKKLKDNADIARVRNRKANQVAVKRLKQASIFLKEGKKDFFYDELLKALWGYTSDKLNIPLSKLDKETIEAQLTESKVGEDIRQEFINILQTCEYARFAPGDAASAMDKLYEQTMDVINKMENTIKR